MNNDTSLISKKQVHSLKKSQMPVIQQIKIFVEHEKISRAELARKLETSVQTVSNMLNIDNYNPKSDLLEKLIESYPQLSTQWLLTGKGTMYKGNYDQGEILMASEPGAEYQTKKEGGYLTMLVQLEACQERVKMLEDRISDKDEIISLLKGKK